VDRAVRWRWSRATVQRGASAGVGLSQFIHALQNISGRPLSSTLTRAVEDAFRGAPEVAEVLALAPAADIAAMRLSVLQRLAGRPEGVMP